MAPSFFFFFFFFFFQLSNFSFVSEHNTATNPMRALSFRSFSPDATGNPLFWSTGQWGQSPVPSSTAPFNPDEGHYRKEAGAPHPGPSS
ncbi:hypothetical protein QBC45DRAFT_102982 [Copromyces sp. CBS 386.78]|nr:hypothetical protein QBC45DRAFT_102982 [Copromyces sp. CBS 386.78]